MANRYSRVLKVRRWMEGRIFSRQLVCPIFDICAELNDVWAGLTVCAVGAEVDDIRFGARCGCFLKKR